MINRISEYSDSSGSPALARAKHALERGNRNVQQAITQLEQLIASNPAAALAAAFAVGVSIAWWLKRR